MPDPRQSLSLILSRLQDDSFVSSTYKETITKIKSKYAFESFPIVFIELIILMSKCTILEYFYQKFPETVFEDAGVAPGARRQILKKKLTEVIGIHSISSRFKKQSLFQRIKVFVACYTEEILTLFDFNTTECQLYRLFAAFMTGSRISERSYTLAVQKFFPLLNVKSKRSKLNINSQGIKDNKMALSNKELMRSLSQMHSSNKSNKTQSLIGSVQQTLAGEKNICVERLGSGEPQQKRKEKFIEEKDIESQVEEMLVQNKPPPERLRKCSSINEVPISFIEHTNYENLLSTAPQQKNPKAVSHLQKHLFAILQRECRPNSSSKPSLSQQSEEQNWFIQQRKNNILKVSKVHIPNSVQILSTYTADASSKPERSPTQKRIQPRKNR